MTSLMRWEYERQKMTMTESFKKADEKFQELMKTVNNRLIEINSGTTSDNRELKCKGNKGLSWYNGDNIIRPKGFFVKKLTSSIIYFIL